MAGEDAVAKVPHSTVASGEVVVREKRDVDGGGVGVCMSERDWHVCACVYTRAHVIRRPTWSLPVLRPDAAGLVVGASDARWRAYVCSISRRAPRISFHFRGGMRLKSFHPELFFSKRDFSSLLSFLFLFLSFLLVPFVVQDVSRLCGIRADMQIRRGAQHLEWIMTRA